MLPVPGITGVTGAQGTGVISVEHEAITGSNVTNKAKIVIVVVSQTAQQAWVKVVENTSTTTEVNTGLTGTNPMEVYVYALDYRGSAKVASVSKHQQVTPA